MCIIIHLLKLVKLSWSIALFGKIFYIKNKRLDNFLYCCYSKIIEDLNFLRLQPSWIERLATNQKVGGSNPSKRIFKAPIREFFCWDSHPLVCSRKRAFYLSQNLTFSQLLFGRVSKRIFKTLIWEFFCWDSHPNGYIKKEPLKKLFLHLIF